MPTETLLVDFKKDTLYVTLPAEIDHHCAKSVREAIDEKLFYYRPKKLLLILSRVSFMDSSGLGLILGRLTRMQELGGTLALADPTAATVKILKLCGLEKKIPIEPLPKAVAKETKGEKS